MTTADRLKVLDPTFASLGHDDFVKQVKELIEALRFYHSSRPYVGQSRARQEARFHTLRCKTGRTIDRKYRALGKGIADTPCPHCN